MNPAFERSEVLLGTDGLNRLSAAHVLVVGVGGVGSWCAEALVRTGLGSLTLVDEDTIAESNLNRQCPALVATVGRPKVEAMCERLLAINPAANITAIAARYPFDGLDLGAFDFVVDAIDSVSAKAELILNASAVGVPLASSMGAALRLDPTRVKVTRFEKVEGDGLARALRQRFKRIGRYPSVKFDCVWTDEPPRDLAARGSLMSVTAAFGMALASRAIAEIAHVR